MHFLLSGDSGSTTLLGSHVLMFGNHIDVEIFPKLPLSQCEAVFSRPVIMCQKMNYVLENTMKSCNHSKWKLKFTCQ